MDINKTTLVIVDDEEANLGRWKQIIIQYCWSFYPSLALSKQLRSLLCACCDSTKDKQKFCPISDDYLFPAPLVLIQKYLKKTGIDNKIFSLHSGHQTLDYVFSEGDYKEKTNCLAMLMILDINMLGVNGIEVFKKIKLSGLTRHIPVFMFTTTDDLKETDECYKWGCNAYIVKPVEHANFVDKICELGAFLKIFQLPGIA